MLCFRFALALVVLLSWILALPASEYQGVRVIAHRGAGFEFDENTLEGCKQSYERGIRGYEVDLRLTRDNQLVLMHDSDVSRTTNGIGVVEQMTLTEVRALRTKKSQAPVPTATELFTFFKDKPDVYFLLEMKTSDKAAYPDERIESYCRQLHNSARSTLPPGTYCFISFDRRALAAMHQLAPDAFTGLLTSAPPTDDLITEAKKLGCRRISVPIDATPRKFARAVRAAGLQLSLWPIRSREDADLAVAFGASILCTDTPGDLLVKKPVP